MLVKDLEGKQDSTADRSTSYITRCLRYWHMKVLKGLGIKSTWILTLKYTASATDQLVSKINGNSSASRQKFLFSWMWPAKRSKNIFFAAHTKGNRQHDDEQNERGLGTNLSQLNENENGRKGGYPT